MRNPIAYLTEPVRRLVDFLFGYDFFISYSHGDGMNYPRQLADRLENLNFKVFLDTREYVAGTDLGRATRRRIRMSNKLLVIARPLAMESDWVRKEVDACLTLGRTPIAVDVNRTLDSADADQPLKARLEDKIYIHESVESQDGAPTDSVVQEIARSFRATRQETLRMRLMSAAAMLFLVLALVAAWLGLIAEDQRKQAVSRQLASQTEDLIDTELDLALLLAATAQDTADTFDSRDILLRTLLRSPRLKHFLHTHRQPWQAAALSHDGRRLVSVGADGRLEVWRVEGTELEATALGEMPVVVTTMALSPDDGTLVAAGEDGHLYFWNMSQGELTARSADAHRNRIVSLTFSPDGQIVVSGAALTEVYSWSVPDGVRLNRFEGLKSAVFASAISPDGTQLATGAEDGKIMLWSLHEGKRISQIQSPDPGYVYSLAYSPDGKYLLAGGENGNIRFFMETPKRWYRADRRFGHKTSVRRMVFDPEGNRLASADADGRIFLWSSKKGYDSPLAGPMNGHKGPVHQLAFDPQGALMSAGDAPYLTVWHIDEKPPMLGQRFKDVALPLAGVAMSHDSTQLAAASCSETTLPIHFCPEYQIRRWSLKEGITSLPSLGMGKRAIANLQFDEQGKWLIAKDNKGAINLWDRQTGKQVDKIEIPSGTGSEEEIRRSESRLGRFKPWNVDALEEMLNSMPSNLHRKIRNLWKDAPLWRDKGGSRKAAIDATGSWLAMARDNSISIWNLQLGNQVADWQFSENTKLVSLDFSDNGKQLAIGGRHLTYSDRKSIIRSFTEKGVLYRVDLSIEPPALKGPLDNPGTVYSLVFSPDDQLLALGGCGVQGSLWCERGFVALMDTDTEMMLGEPFPAHNKSVTYLAFSGKGDALASASREGLINKGAVDVLLWDLNPDTWIERACQISNRSLSNEEARRYFGDTDSTGVCTKPESP